MKKLSRLFIFLVFLGICVDASAASSTHTDAKLQQKLQTLADEHRSEMKALRKSLVRTQELSQDEKSRVIHLKKEQYREEVKFLKEAYREKRDAKEKILNNRFLALSEKKSALQRFKWEQRAERRQHQLQQARERARLWNEISGECKPRI